MNLTKPSLPACGRPSTRLLHHALPFALLVVSAAMLEAQTTYTFNTNIVSATGNWGTAGTWTNNSGSPVAGDTVIMLGGNSKNLGVNTDRTAKDFFFTNSSGAGSVIGNQPTTNSLLTITGVLTMDGTNNLTVRNSTTSLLSADLNQIDLSGSGSLNFGSSSSNPIDSLKIGTLNLNTASSAGVFILGDDGETVTINTINLTEGRIVLRNLTNGSTTLEVGSLGGAGGSVRAANSQSGSTGILRMTNTNGIATFGGLLLDGLAGSVLSLEKAGAGTQVLAGANTYSGYTLISGGVLQIGDGGATGALGTGAVTNNATLIFNRSDSLAYAGPLPGSGQLVQAGGGTLTLSGSNSYTGGTAINAGALALGSADAIGSTGTISFGGGTLRFSSNNVTDYSGRFSTAAGQLIGIDTAGLNVTLASALTSSGGTLTKVGTGTLTLTASNTFNGGTTISGGSLVLSGGNNRLATNGSLTMSSGTVLDVGGNNQAVSGFSGAGSVTNSAGTFTVSGSASGTFSGVISGAGALAKAGAGTLTLAANNSYTGGTFLNGGTLAIDGSGRISGTNGVLAFDGGILLATGAVGVTKTTTLGASGGTFEVATGITNTWNGFISGVGGLTKTGDGVLALGGATNSFNGGVAINGGVVQIGSNPRLGDAAGAVSFDGGTLRTIGTVTASRATTLSAGGGTFEITTNTTTWSGNISGAGGLIKTGVATLTLAGTNTHAGNTTVNEGTMQLSTNGSLRFVIGGNGTNSALLGTGTTVVNGQFAFDLSGASTTIGHSWTIVANSLTNSYGTNFIVSGFSGSGGNWTNTTNGATYVYTQSNSVLTVQSSANNYASWVSFWQGVNPGFTNTAGAADPDGDSFDNNEEFAFDGNPTVGTAALLTATKVGANAVFQWVQRKNPPGGVTYQVRGTTNLATGPWTNAVVTVTNSANTNGINIPADYERKEFQVPATNRSFYRVQAEIAP
jgi:fibronectin-binding autotransporter adhesin